MGNGHPRPLLTRQGASKIPNCSRRLFYQMDRSQAANHHHIPASPAIRVEEHYMQIWCTAYHYHRQ